MPLVKSLGERLTTRNLATWQDLNRKHGEAVTRGKALLEGDVEAGLDYLATAQPYLSEPDNLRNRALFGDVAMWLRQELFACERHAKGQPLRPWFKKLVDRWHAKQVPVITLNYDTLVEVTVASTNLKTPDGETVNAWDVLAVPIPPAEAGQLSAGPASRTFALMKLHGSLSWYYPGAPGYGQPICDIKLYDPWDSGTRPTWEEAGRRAVGRLPFIVPPTFAKSVYFDHEVIRTLWRLAAEAVGEASTIYCLGYSLPAADGPMRSLLATRGSGKRVVVVNKDDKAGKHYQCMLPAAQVDATFANAGVETFVDEYVASA
jgi:hypothetical protein